MPRHILPFTLSLMLLAAGCGGGGGTTGPGTPATGTIAATVDGVAFSTTAAQSVAVSTTPGSLAFQGTQVAGGAARVMSFSLAFIPGTGTYPLGANIGTTPGGIVTYVNGATSYSTPLSGTAGTITITSLTAARVAGTFAFTATPLVGSGAAAVATGGTFDVPRSAGYVVPTADLAGSTITATIGGSPRVMATVTGAGGGSASRFFGGQDLVWSISLSAGPYSAPASGTLTGQTVPLRRIVVQRLGTTQTWGGAGGDTGTFTITSITPTRIVGTFSGTLAPNAGATGTLAVTGGTFDVRTP